MSILIDLTRDDLKTIDTFRTLSERSTKLEEAEDRAFERYMNGTGSASTARAARSRTNAISADLYTAEQAVFAIIDRIGFDGSLERFMEEVQ